MRSASDSAPLPRCLMSEKPQEHLVPCLHQFYPHHKGTCCSEHPGILLPTGLCSSCLGRVRTALNTLGHPSLHLIQLQLSYQVTFSVESPRIIWLAITSASTFLSGHMCGRVQGTHWPAPCHFSFSCPARVPSVLSDPGPPTPYPDFGYSHLFKAPSMQRVLKHPRLYPLQLQLSFQYAFSAKSSRSSQLVPILASAILSGHLLCIELRNLLAFTPPLHQPSHQYIFCTDHSRTAQLAPI